MSKKDEEENQFVCSQHSAKEWQEAVRNQGVPVKVVSEEEAEGCDYVVCMPAGRSPFKDNQHGSCSKCGRAIMFRPHVPKKPPKICYACMIVQVAQDKKDAQD